MFVSVSVARSALLALHGRLDQRAPAASAGHATANGNGSSFVRNFHLAVRTFAAHD
jgi:hypothetical protein